MEKKLDLTVILPIKSAVASFFNEYFEKAIQSLQNQDTKPTEVIIVHTNESLLKSTLDSYDFGELSVRKIEWDLDPSFCEQVNLGVAEAKTKWVSIMEFDDEYSNIWFKNVIKYINIYKDVDAFLPIVVDVDDKLVFAGFTNEATFAANVSTDMGILSNETLQTYQNFQTSGMVFKKQKYQEVGGLKSNIKLTFGYELFLRLTHYSARIMTIPRIGYKHINLREGSIFWNYKNGDDRLDQEEARFWIETAKKEFFFKNERDINYEPQEI